MSIGLPPEKSVVKSKTILAAVVRDASTCDGMYSKENVVVSHRKFKKSP